MPKFARTWAEVDLSALRSNLREIKKQLPENCRLGLVVKADAYGHGLVQVAGEAISSGVEWLLVATAQEGILLRESGIDSPILVLAPILPMEASQAVFYNLSIHVESEELCVALSDEAKEQNKTVGVHLKIDTGMRRFGVQPEDALGVAKLIQSLPNLIHEGTSTHLASAATSFEFTEMQKQIFSKVLEELRSAGVHTGVVHFGNSASLAKYPEAMKYDMVRIGILAYGISHVGEVGFPIKPVLTWKTRIMSLRKIHSGDVVGYQNTFRAEKDTLIATLGVGYGDGYHRGFSNKGFVVICGKRAPVRGLVCMDQTMVDVTEIPDVEVGMEVELLGERVSAVELAEIVGTTPHEMPTRIMSRVPRHYKN